MKKWLDSFLDFVCEHWYSPIWDAIWKKQLKGFYTLYFCGFRISRWIETNALYRFAAWAGMGICHEAAALAMLALKNNKTATLYQGYDYNEQGKLTKHAWVEFRVPLLGWYVCDPMWLSGLAERRRYRKMFPKREVKWRCTYKEFWQIEFSRELYQRIRKPESSYVMDELTLYMRFGLDRFGFHEDIRKFHVLPTDHCGSKDMHPFRLGSEVCWATTMCDFAKNPKRKKPRTRSIRLAEGAYKEFQVVLKLFNDSKASTKVAS